MLTACLITLGDLATLTGGYRYHRRMAELAARNDARLTFASLPPRLPALYGRRMLRAAGEADVVLRALAGALHRLAENEPERRRMAAAAVRRALSLPTWEQSAQQFFAILERVP